MSYFILLLLYYVHLQEMDGKCHIIMYAQPIQYQYTDASFSYW